MGGKNQTSTTSQTYTPAAQSQLNDIWGQVQSAASQPYQAYTGQLTAGLDPTQQAGINTVNSAVGTATPYFNQAQQYATSAAQSIDPSQIQKYESPYNQDVINATQAQFNNQDQQQQQQVLGNAALQGALGGDRVGVTQANLAGQQQLAQAPVIAGLNNQNYSQALSAAQADRAAQAQGAYTEGSLGSAAQNTALQGGQSQLAAGQVAQNTTQAGLSAQYQQYLQQLAFPYQQAQFLASYGLPAATAMGGTQQGTTTAPGPNIFGQILGLGVAGAGAAGSLGYKPFGSKSGGRINGYAAGGAASAAPLNFNFMDVPSYIPQGKMGATSQQPKMMSSPSMQSSQQSPFPTLQSMQSALSNLGMGSNSQLTPQTGATYAAPYIAGQDMTYGSMGGVPVPTFGTTDRSTGGVVSAQSGPYVPQGYDDGGSVTSFADRAFPIEQAIANGTFDPQASNYTPFTQSPTPSQSAASDVPLPQARPDMTASASPQIDQSSLPPQILNPDNVDTSPSSTLGYASSPLSSAAPAQSNSSNKSGLGLSQEANLGLIAAGLGMAASRSPFALTQIGEGGLQGLQTYAQQKQQTQNQANKQQDIDLKAKQLAQSAEQFSKNFGLQQQQFGELQKQRQIQAMQPVKIGSDALGRDVYGIRDPKTGTMQIVDPLTGNIKTPSSSDLQQTSTPLTGDDFLKTLPPQIQNTVKAIASGDSDLSKVGFKDRTAYMNLASQYDPSFNTYTAPLRAQTAKQFTGSGVEARNFQSNDMAIKHIGTGLENIEAMKNSTIPAYNAIANPLARATGNTQFQQANTALGTDIDAIGSELMRAFRGSGSASEKEAAEWRDKFPINGSPVEQRTAMKEAAKLLASRVSASGERYNDAMGPAHARDPLSWLSPEGREVFQTALTLNPQNPVPPRSQWGPPQEGQGQPNAQPSVQSGFTGRTATGPNGSKLRETSDGKWVP